MPASPEPDAYTLAEAAVELGNVTPQRINQLLRNGHLTGPEYPGDRAPKNAPRVWKWSLDEERERRTEAKPKPHSVTHRRLEGPLRQDLAEWFDRREARVNAAAQQLKVAADIARDELKQERKRNSRLRTKLLQITIQQAELMHQILNDLEHESEHAAQVLDGYSEALTQLLGPDDIGPMQIDR